jgi:polar amino acid transport system substrate-binding protein
VKKIYGVILLTLVAVSLVTGCKKKESLTETPSLTKTSGFLTIGMEIGYPPFEYYAPDGKTPAGFDVQMANAIATKLGLEVKIIDTAWDGIFAGVTKGDYDCIMSAVTITDQRKRAHNFTKPYIGNAQAMVLLKNTGVKAKTPEELGGLQVAYQEETTSDIYMTKLAQGGLKFTAREYAKVMSCFEELELKRVDAIVCDSLVAIDYIADPASPFEIVWLGEADEYFGVCLKKGNTNLTAAIDKALDELFADGTMLKISMSVFNTDMVSVARK